MMVAAVGLIWMTLGYAGWRIQIKRMGYCGRFDAFMVGPCMAMGPIFLFIVLNSRY